MAIEFGLNEDESRAYLAKIKVVSKKENPLEVVTDSGVKAKADSQTEKPKSEAEVFQDNLAERKNLHKQTLTPIY